MHINFPHTVIENKVVFCYLSTDVCTLVFASIFSTENFCLHVSRVSTLALLKIFTKNGAFFVQSDLPLKRACAHNSQKRQITFKPKPVLSDQVTMPNTLCCYSDFIKKE